MADPTPAPLLSEQEMLADLYLSLWTQLDVLTGENKWLDIRPADPAESSAEAQRQLEQLQLRLQDPEALKSIRGDYMRTQAFVAKLSGQRLSDAEKSALDGFKAYLQDTGFSYRQAAYAE